MASTEGVNIVISGDSSQAVKAVEDVSKAVDSVKGNSIKITADTSQAQDEINKLANATDSVNDAHAEITADSSQAVDEAKKASNAMENVNDAHVKITADGSQAKDEVHKVADAEESIKDAHSDITADGSQALDELKRLEKLIFGIDGKKVEFQVRGVVRDEQGRLRNLKGQFLKTGNEAGNAFASGAEAGIKRIEQLLSKTVLSNVGGQISSFFASIFDGIISAGKKTADVLSGVMKNALSIGGGFEAQITNVKVVSGATEQELDMLIKKAREMGATLPISAKDSATAMLLLAQRGMQANDILATVSEVANLAISQSTDMATATDLLGSIMTNFNFKVEEAANVTNMLNNASNQSPLTMQKMTEAFKYVGPAAGAMNMQLSEALSMMEAAIRAVGSGEMAGTGIAMTLAKLASESHILGVRTKELNGQFRPMAAIFSELKEKGLGLAEANKIFGPRAGKSALALINLSGSLKEWETNLQKAGSTQAAVNEKSKTFTNTMAALQSAIEELHIEIFEQIKDQSKEAVGGLAELTREFSKWVGETQIAGKSLNAFIEGLGFKIPSGAGFKELLKQFDVQAFVDRIKSFGSTLKEIGEGIVSFFSKIKTPLLWLIEHLETFATISFWGWILGKGLQIPAAIMGIATAFKTLRTIVEGVLALSWAKLIPLLTTPVGLIGTGVAASVGVAAYAANQMSAANEQLKKAVDEEKRYLAEQVKADLTLPVDIQLDFKTGFEKLPESWTKASDKLRAEVDVTIKEMQGKFRGEVSEAVMAVMAKFPEMADSFKDAAGNIKQITDSELRQITSALHGDEEVFKALPEHLKKLTEQLNAMRIAVGKGGTELFGMFNKFRKEIEKPIKKDEVLAFSKELSTSLKQIMTELPAEIEKANKFLGGTNGQLAVKVSLEQARKKLDEFVKTAHEKYAIPKEIIEDSVIAALEDMSEKGNEAALSIMYGWKNLALEFDDFMQKANDAVEYLGEAPQKFDEGIEHLVRGIAKINPLTGEVSKEFKHVYDTLKNWNDLSFSRLSKSLSALRKAISGGFVDNKELENVYQSASNQVKLKVVTDLRPLQSMLSPDAFKGVIASEYTSLMEELGGKVFMKGVKKEFSTLAVPTGKAMGSAILAHVDSDVGGKTFTINGIDQLQQEASKFTQGLGSIANLPQNISNAVSPYVAKLEQLNSTQGGQPSFTASTAVKDYSAVIASIVREIQASSQANVTAVNGVTSAVNAVETAVKSHQTEINTQGSISQALSSAIAPLVSRIEQSGAVYQSSSTSMTRGMSELAGSINTLKNSADANVSAMAQLQASVKAAGDSYNSANVTSAITPLASAVNNLSTAFNAFSAIQQANSSAFGEVINAMRSVENALKSISTGNNYDIDINQQGFMIEKKSDADMLARSTVSALRAGIGNGGI